MVGVFIGAGFAKWSMNLPLVHELFDFNISNIRSKDEIWFDKLQSVKNNWDSLNPSSSNEEFIRFLLEGQSKRLKKYLSKYLARRLSEPFLCKVYGPSTQTFMYNDNKLKELTGIKSARLFFESIGLDKIVGIITTNYDLIIEYGLGTQNFNYGRQDYELQGRGNNPVFPWQNTPVLLNGTINLSKIHGSISYDGLTYWSSGICGLNGNALIVPPSPEKKQVTELRKEWKNAKCTLNKIHELIIVGFNFNEYDTAVLKLLKTNAKNMRKITIYDIESKIEKASKIWDKKRIIELEMPNK